LTRADWPARHELPELDALALAAAGQVDRMIHSARERDLVRWVAFLEPLPDVLRDGDPAELRRAARHARAAYGPKDSIREALPVESTEALLECLDRLLAALARAEIRL
jgi:hypothetical protein